MNHQFYAINNQQDVISLKEASPNNIIISQPMFKVQDVVEKCICRLLNIESIDQLEPDKSHHHRKKWIDEGLECEVLNLGSTTWKQGKVRIKVTVEFCPDAPEIQEPESCLDDIRREIQKM